MVNWWDHLNATIGVAITLLISAGVWVVRTTFTNQKEIEMLKQEIAFRVSTREKHDAELQSQLAEVRQDIKHLIERLL